MLSITDRESKFVLTHSRAIAEIDNGSAEGAMEYTEFDLELRDIRAAQTRSEGRLQTWQNRMWICSKWKDVARLVGAFADIMRESI